MWGRPRPPDTDTIHHNFAGCFWRLVEFLMKPSNLHERRQLFSTASQWYLPFTLCHLKDRPRGEWRFVPAAAVCPAGLIKCSTWWVGAICLFARLHIRVLSWFLFLVIILVVLPILHFQPRCQVAYAEHRAHVCGGKVSGSTRQWKIKATSKEHLWPSLLFFSNSRCLTRVCFLCFLQTVDISWFALICFAFAPATQSHFQCCLTNRPGFNESE